MGGTPQFWVEINTPQTLRYAIMLNCSIGADAGQPRTLIEAAAMARPLTATDVPRCRAVVENGLSGFLFKVRDADSLADQIPRVLALPHSAREAMSQAARAHMERDYCGFRKYRTAISLSPGHLGDGWSLRCCHASSVMISGFSVWVNPGLGLFRRMLSPFNSMRWALWMMRSRIASAMVGSPII